MVGAGENYGLDFTVQAGDYVIAADAGFVLLEQEKIAVDLAIGDFDTMQCRPRHPNVILLDTEKDDTDMRAAVLEGIRAGYEIFCIYCGTGGRMEHTIANIQLLAELSQQGRRGFLFGKDAVITAVTNGSVSFPENASGYLSVFSHSDRSAGVYLKGLKYELENAVLTNTYPLGVSNEFIGEKSKVLVERGTLLLVFPRKVAVNKIT